MTKADIVSYWFAETIATRDIAADADASGQAVAAKDDLDARLATGAASDADTVQAWFREKIATGPIARNTAAYSQAFRARDDLIGRLAAVQPDPAPAVAKPKPAAPPEDESAETEA